jgi:hypothetical protein
MELAINKFGIEGSPTEATMRHNGEELLWNIALFDRVSVDGRFDIFSQINDYWRYIQKPYQDKIFDIYKRIKTVYETIWNTNELTKQLYTLVAELYDQHDFNDLEHWTKFHSNVILPDGLRETYVESHENPGSRERTYLKEDYWKLLVLSISLRIMIPVWGEFIARTRKESGTALKEFYAFQLLAYSNIAKSEPMEQLRIYVEHSIPTEKSMSSAILAAISSEDFTTWALALVVVRRLCVGDVRGVEVNSSLVPVIYKFLGQKVKSHDSSFMGLVKEKITEGQGQESENNLSKLEGYKVKQELPAGDIAIISHYVKDPVAMALRLCSDLDLRLLELSLESVRVLETEQIWKPQMVIMQWVLKTVIPPKGLFYINKTLSLKALAVAQAVLWHKGHYELAGLISAIEYSNDDELNLGGNDGRARITKDQLEQLDVLYPFSKKPLGKQKVLKRVNPAIDAIDSVSSLFGEHEWKLTAPRELVTLITGNPDSISYSTPYDIKIKLANLAIALSNKTF